MKCQDRSPHFGIYFRFYKVCTKRNGGLQNIYKMQKLKITKTQSNTVHRFFYGYTLYSFFSNLHHV
jgi:hypothetical protein